ncbi:hypothetical protein J7438_23905 [Thalassotalea sp. G20_0]|uniref:hypothetical protein n=1 Tax=Thalassotalea sp. G20_0 TaxID=2821093 RepID=UPI001ADA301C|nr:hypothetical protein [Thalassotalea sp. G20_0]MBO9497108.1 hypothetical protein [Thalassotalea sp. G20_0]
MKFYNLETEFNHLQNWSNKAATGGALMTIVTGRRRVGKTALLNQAFPRGGEHRALYLFVSRKQERLLCEEFVEQIRALLNVPIFGNPSSLREVLEILLQYSCTEPLTLILDEFQDIQRSRLFFRTPASLGSVQRQKPDAPDLLWFTLQPDDAFVPEQ